MTTFLDTFNRADSSSPGANYTGLAVSLSPFTIASNKLAIAGGGTPPMYRNDYTAGASADMFVELVEGSASPSDAGPRATMCNPSTGDTYDIYRVSSGGFAFRKNGTGLAASAIGGFTPPAASTLARIRMERRGNNVFKIICNGVDAYSYTDPSPATVTRCGITGSLNATTVSEFSGGDLTSGTAPTDVTGLAAGTITSTSVALSWTAPGTGTAPITYTVNYRANSTGAYTQFATGVSGTSTTVTGLTAATAYQFQVVANNGTGNAPGTGAGALTTATTAAAAPAPAPAPATASLLSPAVGNGAVLLPSTAFANLNIVRVSDRVQVLSLTNVTTDTAAKFAINANASLVAGVAYLGFFWNSDASQVGHFRATAT